MLKSERWVVGFVVVLTVGFLIALVLNVSPYLRGPGEWRWAYAIPGQPLRHLLPVVVVGVYTAVFGIRTYRLSKQNRLSKRQRNLFLLLLWLAVPVIQLALLWAESPDVIQPLFFRTISPGASGIFTVGSGIDNVWDYLRHYPELMPTFPVHPQRYPPGLPLFFYGMRQFFEQMPQMSDRIGFFLRQYQCQDLALMRLSNATMATAVLQMALPLINGLIVFPLFGLARRTLGVKTAVWTVFLYPLIPSFALWAARWDQFYPLVTVVAWYLLCVGLMDRRRWALLLSGVVLSFGTLLSFGLVAMLAPMGIWAVLWWWGDENGRSLTQLVVDGLIFALGLVSIWAMYQLAFGIGFLDIWRVSMSFHLGLERGYWTWLFYHLYDFGIFLTIPLALFFVFGFARAVRQIPRKLMALPLAFGLGLLMFDFSGTAQGEVARVWLFLTPFAVMVAAWALSVRVHSARWMGVLVVLTAVHLLTFNTFLRVVTTGVPDPIPHEAQNEQPAVTHAVDASIGENIRLFGFDLDESNEQILELKLLWQTITPMTQSYTVFVHVLDINGQLVAQQDGMPVQGSLPTTCWQSGEFVTDVYQLSLSQSEPYQLVVGMYLLETGERLPVTGAAALDGNRAFLKTWPIKGKN
ncbi:MAG: hypothetical protein DWQ04_29695 [Chloroflexi bacterium]|nr:MAG: hypothetical protein DWQ04_29695 [Chloroflexota bacterium]